MLYRLLKFVIGVGIRLYYNEVKVKNKQHLPQREGPVIIVANHPNTLMDAWVIGMICKQPIHFMAKATLFDSKLKLRLLRSLNLIPINRQGEGITKGVDNMDSLTECYEVLAAGKTLVIFPEGTSYKERVLRKLKTGTARIALETEQRNGGELGVKIVAVGLNYSQQEKFRSNILIDVDEPHDVRQYLEEYKKNKHEASMRLTKEIRRRLERVLLTAESQDEELLIENIYKVLNTRYQEKKIRGVSKEVADMKEITRRLDEIKILQPWRLEEIKNKLKSIDWKLEKMHIRTDFLDRKFRSVPFLKQVLISMLFVLIAMPVALFGVLHNIFQYLFSDWLVPKISKDIEYYAPLAILVGTVLYPVTYALWGVLAYLIFDLRSFGMVIYILLLPTTGLFAYWFIRYLKNISYSWQYMLLLVDRKSTLHALREEKKRLHALLYDDNI